MRAAAGESLGLIVDDDVEKVSVVDPRTARRSLGMVHVDAINPVWRGRRHAHVDGHAMSVR